MRPTRVRRRRWAERSRTTTTGSTCSRWTMWWPWWTKRERRIWLLECKFGAAVLILSPRHQKTGATNFLSCRRPSQRNQKIFTLNNLQSYWHFYWLYVIAELEVWGSVIETQIFRIWKYTFTKKTSNHSLSIFSQSGCQAGTTCYQSQQQQQPEQYHHSSLVGASPGVHHNRSWQATCLGGGGIAERERTGELIFIWELEFWLS